MNKIIKIKKILSQRKPERPLTKIVQEERLIKNQISRNKLRRTPQAVRDCIIGKITPLELWNIAIQEGRKIGEEETIWGWNLD